MKERTNVLIIDNSVAVTGAITSISLLLPYLKNHRFILALPKGSQVIPTFRRQGLSVFEFPFLEISKSIRVVLYLPVLLFNTFNILRLVKKEEIKLIHVNDVYNLCGVAVKIFNPKVKLVYHIRLLSTSYLRPVYKYLAAIILRYADAVVCNSLATKESLPRSSKPVFVIGNPINPDEKYPLKIVKEGSRFILLYPANYVPGKGHDYALEAVAVARESLPFLQLIITGGTFANRSNQNYKKRLMERASELGIEGAVEFRDFEHDIEKLMKTSDIVLQFSVSESFSRVTSEAMQYGVPVIAVNSGGPAELIKHGVTGMLVEPGDIKAMAAAITTLAGNENLREKMATAARDYIIHNFETGFIANQIERVYHGVLVNYAGYR